MIKNIGWTLGNDCPCKCKYNGITYIIEINKFEKYFS